MASTSLKIELADHIYHYLCHEALHSDLSEAAKESLTAASECIEQAYRLNVTNNNTNHTSPNAANSGNQSKHPQQQQQSTSDTSSSPPSPDELLRIFTRHKELMSQQERRRDPKKLASLRNNSESSSTEKPDVRAANSANVPVTQTNDSHNLSNPSAGHLPSVQVSAAGQLSTPTATASLPGSSSGSGSAKQHSQHPISQLPMTTRKKLSHLRAQIKRQASKAARSRLEKRSSVSATGSGTHSGTAHGLAASFGLSLDAGGGANSRVSGDGLTARELANQGNSSSIDSPTTGSSHLNNQCSSSPTTCTPASGGFDTMASSSQLPSSNNSHHHQQQQNQQNESSSSGSKHSSHLLSGSHHHHMGVSVHQKNFKQKLIALIKKFRTDGSDFDSEEQYREALERELMKAAAGRGSREIEELLEEDIDVEGESGSELEDWDNISESSTPKPSLRPFFSSTTLDKI